MICCPLTACVFIVKKAVAQAIVLLVVVPVILFKVTGRPAAGQYIGLICSLFPGC